MSPAGGGISSPHHHPSPPRDASACGAPVSCYIWVSDLWNAFVLTGVTSSTGKRFARRLMWLPGWRVAHRGSAGECVDCVTSGRSSETASLTHHYQKQRARYESGHGYWRGVRLLVSQSVRHALADIIIVFRTRPRRRRGKYKRCQTWHLA